MDRDNDSDKLVEKHYGFEWYARFVLISALSMVRQEHNHG